MDLAVVDLQDLVDLAAVDLAAVDLQDLVVVVDLQDLAVVVDLQDLAVVVEEDTVGDTDPDFYNLDISKDGLALIYKSVCFHLEKWSGGDPREQEALFQLKDNLFRLILEKTLES